MKILLDTHVIIWALTDDPRLSEKARSVIDAPENIILYSAVSLWEIAIKNQKAPEKCPYHEKDIMRYCDAAGYLSLGMLPAHVPGVRELLVKEGRYLSNHDPFDRMLLAQAKAEGCEFLTHDAAFQNYDESCIALI